MDIVENKHGKFDIDTVEGAEAYLESEGVNVTEYLQKGIAELRRHKILNEGIRVNGELFCHCSASTAEFYTNVDKCRVCGLPAYRQNNLERT